jgi:hypothetical protein
MKAVHTGRILGTAHATVAQHDFGGSVREQDQSHQEPVGKTGGKAKFHVRTPELPRKINVAFGTTAEISPERGARLPNPYAGVDKNIGLKYGISQINHTTTLNL